MQTLTSAQCRAARALLNWTQPELAERCGVHVQTFSNFEKESSTPSKSTLEKIGTILTLHGIELLDGNGIREINRTIQQYEGKEGFKMFMDDVYETAKKMGGEICLLNAKPDNWIKWLGTDWQAAHSKRMCDLGDHISAKITTKEGEYNFISSTFAEYRWVPKQIWNQHSFYAYGDKVAFLNFQEETIHIFVLKHAPFAKTHKFLFNMVWDNHTIIPDTPNHKPADK